MAITLRDYQKEAVKSVENALLNGFKRVCFGACVGAGKSVMLSYLAGEECERGGTPLLMTHRSELLLQDYDKFNQLFPYFRASIFSASLSSKDLEGDAIFASYQSIQGNKKALQTLKDSGVSLIIIDEAHLVGEAGGYRKILEFFDGVAVIGGTGTPWRLTGGNQPIFRTPGWKPSGVLRQKRYNKRFFETLVADIRVADLMERNFLVPMVLPSKPVTPAFNTKELTVKQTGDYDDSEIEDQFIENRNKVIQEIIEQTKDHRVGFVFCPVISIAELVQETFFAFDEFSCAIITGMTPKKERDAILEKARNEKIKYLISVDTLTTGVDIPNATFLVSLRPSMSSSLVLQMMGRVIRPCPEKGKKEALLLDFSGWVGKFGLPEQISIPENHDDDSKRKNKEDVFCEGCDNYISFELAKKNTPCPYCANIYWPVEAQEPQEKEKKERNFSYSFQTAIRGEEVNGTLVNRRKSIRVYKDGSEGLLYELIISSREDIIKIYCPINHSKKFAKDIARKNMTIIDKKDIGDDITLDLFNNFWNVVR